MCVGRLNHWKSANGIRGAAARPNPQDLTAALLRYIDKVEKDELIFDLGVTYRCAREGSPIDFYNMADLSDLLVAILKVVPGGRIRKTDMRNSLLDAIMQRSEKVSKVTNKRTIGSIGLHNGKQGIGITWSDHDNTIRG